MRAALASTALSCVLLAAVITPRRAEYKLLTALEGDGQSFFHCTRFYNWWDRRIEELTGIPPCCIGVTINGDAGNVHLQLEAVSKLQSSRLSLVLDGHDSPAPSGLHWDNVTDLSVEQSNGEFLESILEAAPRLESLTLYDCYAVNDEDLRGLSSLRRLATIDIDGAGVDGSFIAALKDINVKALSVRYAMCCTQQSIESLADVGTLESIYLSGSGYLEIDCLGKLAQLDSLVLDGFDISAESRKKLMSQLPKLHLDVRP